MKPFEEIKKSTRCIWDNISNDGMSGMIYMHRWIGSIVISNGAGWEHVSVAPMKRNIMPTWEEMCFIKDLFFYENEAVLQIHPPKSEYVNMVKNCLHLWKCTYKEMVLPPQILVGINKNMSKSEFENKAKEAYEIAGGKCDRQSI